MKEQLIHFLRTDLLQNAIYLNLVKAAEEIEVLYLDNSLGVFQVSGYTNLCIVGESSHEELKYALDKAHVELVDFSVARIDTFEKIKSLRAIEWELPLLSYALLSDTLPHEIAFDGKLDVLTPDMAEICAEHYHSYPEEIRADYLRERITNGPSVAAYIDEQLAGFVLTHDDHTIGALEVLPEYKRRGIGYVVERELMKKVLNNELIPTCCVHEDNDPSISLQKKLGFTQAPYLMAYGTFVSN